MDRAKLAEALRNTFDAPDASIRAVSRQAGDLADSGQVEADGGYDPTPETIVEDLQDAPDGHSLVERWNWWLGSLELAYGGDYRQFRVRSDIGQPDAE